MSAEARGDATGYTLGVRVPSRSRTQVERAAAAFARGLASRHVAAEARVEARTEPAWGSALAMAVERFITVRVDPSGKSDAEVEAEVRAQLEESGVSDADVQYRREGDQTSLRIAADADGRALHIEQRVQGARDRP